MGYGYYTPATAIHPRDAFCIQLRLIRKKYTLSRDMTAYDRNVICVHGALRAMGITCSTQGERYIAYLASTKHQTNPKPFVII